MSYENEKEYLEAAVEVLEDEGSPVAARAIRAMLARNERYRGALARIKEGQPVHVSVDIAHDALKED